MGDLTRHHYGFRKCDGFPQWDKNVVFFCVLITWRQRVSVGELHKVLIVLCGWCSSPTKLVANVSLRRAPRLRGVGKWRICIVIHRLASSYLCDSVSIRVVFCDYEIRVHASVTMFVASSSAQMGKWCCLQLRTCACMFCKTLVNYISNVVIISRRYTTQGFFQSTKTCVRGKAKLRSEVLEKYATIHMARKSKTQEIRFRMSLWLSPK